MIISRLNKGINLNRDIPTTKLNKMAINWARLYIGIEDEDKILEAGKPIIFKLISSYLDYTLSYTNISEVWWAAICNTAFFMKGKIIDDRVKEVDYNKINYCSPYLLTNLFQYSLINYLNFKGPEERINYWYLLMILRNKIYINNIKARQDNRSVVSTDLFIHIINRQFPGKDPFIYINHLDLLDIINFRGSYISYRKEVLDSIVDCPKFILRSYFKQFIPNLYAKLG